MTPSQYRIYKIYVVLAFIAVILSIPLAFVLPVEWSFENGFIENAQVIILIARAIWILKIRSPIKWFQRFYAAGMVLIALRELSWGRVFFLLEMEKLGPVFVSMADYEYRVYVYILLTIYVSAMLIMLIRFVPVREIISCSQPLATFGIIFMAVLLNYIGDKGLFIGKVRGQILEESNELIIYITLTVVALYWIWQKNPSDEFGGEKSF